VKKEKIQRDQIFRKKRLGKNFKGGTKHGNIKCGGNSVK
jgi:hypothetical protein